MKTLADFITEAKKIYSEKAKGLSRLVCDASPQKLDLLSQYAACKDDKERAETIVNEKSELVGSGEFKDIFTVLKHCAHSQLAPESGEEDSHALLSMLHRFNDSATQMFCGKAAIFTQLKNKETETKSEFKSVSEKLGKESEKLKKELLELQQIHSDKDTKIKSLKEEILSLKDTRDRLQKELDEKIKRNRELHSIKNQLQVELTVFQNQKDKEKSEPSKVFKLF